MARSRRLTTAQLGGFTGRLATLVGAHVPLARALPLAVGRHDVRLARIASRLACDVEGELSLSAALARHPAAFDPVYRALIEAGESTGTLGLQVAQLACLLARRRWLHLQLKRAALYAAGLALGAGLLVALTLGLLVPAFQEIYADVGADLPLPTVWLIHASAVQREHGGALLGALLALSLAAWLGRRLPAWCARRAWALRLPLLGPVLERAALGRFSRTLALLLDAGTPGPEALELAGRAGGNAALTAAAARLRAAIERGADPTTCLVREPLFDEQAVHLFAHGLQTGRLPAILAQAAERDGRSLDTCVGALLDAVQPALLLLVGGGIGLMVYALFSPLLHLVE